MQQFVLIRQVVLETMGKQPEKPDLVYLILRSTKLALWSGRDIGETNPYERSGQASARIERSGQANAFGMNS